jgi:hypothetical protein
MAVTIANVSHPNQDVWEGEFLGQKARVIDVTFDDSYANSTGEVVTAATLGLQAIYGVFVLQNAFTSNTADLGGLVIPVVKADRTEVALRLYGFTEDAGSTWQGLNEAADTTNLSTYSCRICVIGA